MQQQTDTVNKSPQPRLWWRAVGGVVVGRGCDGPLLSMCPRFCSFAHFTQPVNKYSNRMKLEKYNWFEPGSRARYWRRQKSLSSSNITRPD